MEGGVHCNPQNWIWRTTLANPSQRGASGRGFHVNLPIMATSWVNHQDCVPPQNAPGKLKSSEVTPKAAVTK